MLGITPVLGKPVSQASLLLVGGVSEMLQAVTGFSPKYLNVEFSHLSYN